MASAIALLQSSPAVSYELIDSPELAKRWCLPESWVREHVRERAGDPIPHVRFGKYVRFQWASPELEDWISRRKITATNNSTVRRVSRKEMQ